MQEMERIPGDRMFHSWILGTCFLSQILSMGWENIAVFFSWGEVNWPMAVIFPGYFSPWFSSPQKNLELWEPGAALDDRIACAETALRPLSTREIVKHLEPWSQWAQKIDGLDGVSGVGWDFSLHPMPFWCKVFVDALIYMILILGGSWKGFH